MRSVVIHLANTTHAAVREQLSIFAGKPDSDEWRYPHGSAEPILYIEFYDDFKDEFEPEGLKPLQMALGQMPDVTVIANISGRVPADAEARKFVDCLLSVFRGVADDGYSDHLWTLNEIQSQAKFHGHSFFDYKGWYEDSPAS